jgi:RNA polymerase sigma factor (sigma-70 family)
MDRRKDIADLLARGSFIDARLRSRLRKRSDVPDLSQETYLRFLRTTQATKDAIKNPEAYLLRIAYNLASEHAFETMCREKIETPTDPHDLPEYPVEIDYAEECHLDAQKARLGRVIMRLAARYQVVLCMTYADGLTQEEIAKQLNVSRSMVQKILKKALAHCRACMIREGER